MWHWTIAVGAIGVVVSWTSALCAECPIRSDAESQDLIAKWWAAADRDDRSEHFALLADLETRARKNYSGFAQQVVRFVYDLQGQDQVRGAAAYRLFLWCGVPSSEIATGLGEYLY